MGALHRICSRGQWEPPTLDSDGEGSKPPPPRGRGCGRKRKGTPVKVCDRVFVTEDEEESLSEHSYCPGDGQYQEGEEDRLPPPDGPYYLADPSQLCVSELGEEGGSGARAAVLYPPPPNCRIREVHCGSQVRLVVIAIRDIAKGEEITVDYSLTEWGENAMGFHSSVSPGGFECISDPESNIKKEEESGPVSLPLSVSDYLTPSWSLSPSSSPLSHSEPSDSDHDEDEEEDEDSPAVVPTTTNINNNININIGRDGAAGMVEAVVGAGQRQCCLYCGRHFRSLARHLEKHHAQQPEEATKEGMPEESRAREEESGGEEKKGMISRPHMMPLLSSLSSLVMYLRRLQHSAFLSLSRSPQSAEAWRLLCHASLALLILYNRRRECEASKLTIQEYKSRVTPQCPIPVPPGAPPALTPLEASLSPSERQVLPHLPRVGVQGKRGRVQPLILPPHSEPCLELLLQTRPGVGVDPQNPYVAILTQLLLLGEGEGQGAGPGPGAAQRLESFLQKEYHVTQSCAGIGQDPGLMGRVGRVVLCGERDGVLFRGMSLHHICLELDVMSGNSADSFSDDSDGEHSKEKPGVLMVKKGAANGKPPRQRKGNSAPPNAAASFPAPNGRKRGAGQPKPGKRGVLKRPWSEAERTAVESHLTRNIMELRVPAKADCERCLQLCPLLVSNRRDWRAIKFYCHNRIQLLKKRGRRESLAMVEALPTCGGRPVPV
ncbi:hypothetical protein AAFF_G00179710 [Aldrovandia affinis]|uniref:SET domain-containing protein n=1 Tax=Aldrovandia affinis TaxID=143900 RepID=A0AAD7WVD3_9TELE|nr:hypothetical protein AAFF_G00179710 [Aldrovandia affinis]